VKQRTKDYKKPKQKQGGDLLTDILTLPILGAPRMVNWVANKLAETAEQEEMDEPQPPEGPDRGRGPEGRRPGPPDVPAEGRPGPSPGGRARPVGPAGAGRGRRSGGSGGPSGRGG